MNEEWRFDFEQACWMLGTDRDGAGVFLTDDGWEGNAVCGNNIVHVGPHDTIEATQEAALGQLSHMRQSYLREIE